MSVDPTRAAATIIHDGETYYFCCAGCSTKFQTDPDRYLKGSAASSATSATEQAAPSAPPPDSGAIYTCPMHPEVRKVGPGACPKCGMALEPEAPTLEEDTSEQRDLARRFWLSLALTAPILAYAMLNMLPEAPAHDLLGRTVDRWFEIVLATPVVLYGAWPFFLKGAASIRSHSPNMFTLIAIGVGVAYVYSVFATLAPELFPMSMHDAAGRIDVYYESAAVITTLVLLGQLLETRARGRAGTAIRELLRLSPPVARRLNDDGSESDVALADVHEGDRLRVRPGDKVPIDGVILEGAAMIDESMLTGESVAVTRRAGDEVFGGAVNREGSFILRVMRTGAETTLAQIIRMVAEAQRSRAPIQGLADRVAGLFVPGVIAIAALSFLIWWIIGPAPSIAHALVAAVSVLIIACPCALGLATPMSIMVASGRGASMGVLFKSAEALERLEQIDTIVFDKTGTLTEGRPALVGVEADGVSEDEMLTLAAAVERLSEHPLAEAVVRAAEERRLDRPQAGDFESYTGEGASATVNGRRLAVGNRALMERLNVNIAPLTERADQRRSKGATALFVAIDDRPAGVIAVADVVKPTSAEAIRDLHQRGLRLVMLTGDHRASAEAIASDLHLDEIRAEVKPDEKARIVRELQDGGAVVLMAGDGVNDAPALAQADVGVAMGTGAGVAIESAGVTLVKGDLRGIVRAISLSRATMRNIRQNLVFAFGYNALGVPIAAGVLYPIFGLLLSPMIAAAAMSFSSVSVIGNALRLRRMPIITQGASRARAVAGARPAAVAPIRE